jgi:4-amino-4-deoxy-L-arabinose transferase-like glycosyltransferase
VCFLYEDQLSPDRGYFHFGWETGRVAQSLATGRGFSSPLFGETGPTAWVLPLYAYLLAAVFKLFGVYTAGSALTILGLNSLFSALTCIPVYFIAKKIFGAGTAIRAAWFWALFPYAIDFAAERVWGDCLNALLLSLMFWGFLHLRTEKSKLAWAGVGLLSGVAALNNTTALLVAFLLAAFVCFERRQERNFIIRRVLPFALGLMVFVGPWCIRNYVVFDRLIPVRDNFWLEMRVGNTGDTTDLFADWAHPATDSFEMETYRYHGELNYMAEKRKQAIEFITEKPWTFAWLTIRRIVYFWTGLHSLSPSYLRLEPFSLPNVFFCTAITLLALIGLRVAARNVGKDAVPFALVLFTYPLVYYVTHASMDYRHPIDPLMVILGVEGALGFSIFNRGALPLSVPKFFIPAPETQKEISRQ